MRGRCVRLTSDRGRPTGWVRIRFGRASPFIPSSEDDGSLSFPCNPLEVRHDLGQFTGIANSRTRLPDATRPTLRASEPVRSATTARSLVRNNEPLHLSNDDSVIVTTYYVSNTCRELY